MNIPPPVLIKKAAKDAPIVNVIRMFTTESSVITSSPPPLPYHQKRRLNQRAVSKSATVARRSPEEEAAVKAMFIASPRPFSLAAKVTLEFAEVDIHIPI